MTFDYAQARALALRVITKYGGPGSVVRKGISGGFDDNGVVAADTPDFTIDGTITPLIQYKTNEIDNSSILQGDAWVFFDSTTEPEVGMHVTLNSRTFRIVKVFPLSSVDDVNIFRKLQLRK